MNAFYLSAAGNNEGKAKGLLRREDIGRVRDRAARPCLDIFDRTDRRRIRVEYQLNGFEALRGLLNAKVGSAAAEEIHFRYG